MSSVPDLGLPGSNRSGRPLAGEYMLRPGSGPPQRGQSAARVVSPRIKSAVRIENREIEFLPRSRRDRLHFASATEHFPLTLALSLSSLREREQSASDGCSANI